MTRFLQADVKLMLDLVGELNQPGMPFVQLAERLVRSLCKMVRAQIGIFSELHGYRPKQPWRIVPLLDFGWGSQEERQWNMNFFDGPQLDDPMTNAVVGLPGAIVTRSRAQMVHDRDWYTSANVNELRRRARIDHCIYSNYFLDDTGRAYSIALHRAWGDKSFSARDVAIVQMVHEAQPLYRRQPPCTAVRHLTPREQQVLEHLKRGDAEKQIGAHLGISRHTVHVYVRSLYEKYNVGSRGELMSLWLQPRAVAG